MPNLNRMIQALPQLVAAIIAISTLITGAASTLGSSKPSTPPATEQRIGDEFIDPDFFLGGYKVDFVKSITVAGKPIQGNAARATANANGDASVARDFLDRHNYKTLTFNAAWDENVKRDPSAQQAVIKVYLGRAENEYAKTYVVRPGESISAGPINISGLEYVSIRIVSPGSKGVSIYNARLHR
ncbi:hypothetical protein [Corynebacterium sp. Marseille-Q2823]|uniref:hypothetical protein n=1 Tax=Corynebacterium sp. Marseille-Q2823 TaxID=2736606 RepID=UPI00158B719A|nr:hypothetical protein [Corynebacterium sp. Marseille-Q2823]